ncbi:MAG: 23S rRNA (adenine(2503)-C(2))-methyltransferase RlmN [Myxococcota bacterium]
MSWLDENHVDEGVERLQELAERYRQDEELELEPSERVDLMNYSLAELKKLVEGGLDERDFRADQIFEWMYRHLAADFDSMTNLSKDFRAKLADLARVSPITFKGAHPSGDGTTKLTFKCDDNAVIETVLIPSENRNTLCVSSQVGCAMGCTFCYTAKMGLKRNLTAAEIVAQVVEARRRMTDEFGRIGNIVFMGMGEPLHNYDNVVRAIHVLTDQLGLDFSKRRVTVSTSGLVPELKKLGEDTDVQLAVSLNGTEDEQRSELMPVNDRWGIDELLDTLREFPLENRERITFEYVLIKGITDRPEDAQRLVELVRDIPSKVNIIPFNPHPKTPFETPTEERIDQFQQYLIDNHVHVLRRATRGRDSMAACGQLGEPGDEEPKHVKMRLDEFRRRAEQAATSG